MFEKSVPGGSGKDINGEDTFLGLVNLFGVLVPTWYFATIPILSSICILRYEPRTYATRRTANRRAFKTSRRKLS
jgi:hypothetical protein